MRREDYKPGMQLTGGEVPIVEPQVDGVIKKGAFITCDGRKAATFPSLGEIEEQITDPSDIAALLAAAKKKLDALASAIHRKPMRS